MFIRLAHCNLQCSYCDTLYANINPEYKEYTVDQLVNLVLDSKEQLVEITGGEPLLHEETPILCQKLIDNNIEVLLETNGSISIENVPKKVCRILDCKLPDSGMAEKNNFANYKYLTPKDEVKFVISSFNDFNYAVNVIDKYDLFTKTQKILASPVWGRVEFSDLAQWVIDSKLPIRMQLQMHKIIWGDKKGV
jgi:7-carboxy-7-deazaguanine synthase